MALEQDDLRQLHERSFPQKCAGRVYLCDSPDDDAGRLAYIPGFDQALGAHGDPACNEAALRGRAVTYLVGGERRKSTAWPAANRSSPVRAGANPISQVAKADGARDQ